MGCAAVCNTRILVDIRTCPGCNDAGLSGDGFAVDQFTGMPRFAETLAHITYRHLLLFLSFLSHRSTCCDKTFY